MQGNPSWTDRPGEVSYRSVIFNLPKVKTAEDNLIARMQSLDGTSKRLVGLDTLRAEDMACSIAAHLPPDYNVQLKTAREAYLSGPPVTIIARDGDDPAALARGLLDRIGTSPSERLLGPIVKSYLVADRVGDRYTVYVTRSEMFHWFNDS